MSSPWSISSRKKLPAPKMSRNSAALRRAPCRSRRSAARSGSHRTGSRWCRSARWRTRRAARGRRAACRRSPRVLARDESRNRLCMPAVFSASSVMWVNAPPPETSSSPPSAQRTRVRSKREVFGREVGLHADDRLDAGRAWLACRSRRRRTRCRGRSSRAPACPSGPSRRTARSAGRRRRAWSTRCARAGARTSQFLHVPRRLRVPLGTTAALLRP